MKTLRTPHLTHPSITNQILWRPQYPHKLVEQIQEISSELVKGQKLQKDWREKLDEDFAVGAIFVDLSYKALGSIP